MRLSEIGCFRMGNIITRQVIKLLNLAKLGRITFIYLMCTLSLMIFPSISLGGAVGTLTVNLNTNPENCNVLSISGTAVLESDNTYNLSQIPNACGCNDYRYALFYMYINDVQKSSYSFHRCCQTPASTFFPASKTLSVNLSNLTSGNNTIRFDFVDRSGSSSVVYKTKEVYVFVDPNGNRIDMNDNDEDGVLNCDDNCKEVPNTDQSDTDGDDFGDVCDNCLDEYNSGQEDNDGDGFGNICDNCPDIANPGQEDSNNDGIGDECDCYISLSITKAPLAPWDTATVTAKTIAFSGTTVNWSISKNHSQRTGNADATISGNGLTAAITDAEGEGWIVIRAENPDDSSCYKEAKLYIGCDCKDCDKAGGGFVELSSIDVRFSLGFTKNGESAGSIFLNTHTVSPLNSTPEILEFYSFNNDAEVLYESNILRQIVSPETFVDIVVINPYNYQLRFYRPEALGAYVGGYYEVIGGAVPFVTWTVENPDASDTIYNRLKITEDRGGSIKSYDYEWDAGNSTWSLIKGNGLQIKTKKEELIGGNRVVTEILKDSLDHIASKTKTTWHEFPWGEEIIEENVDPDNTALTSTMTYYDVDGENGYGHIKSQVNSDGSWVRYEYDSDDRKTAEISSWLDSPVGTAAGSARAVYYDYTVQDSSDSDMPEDIRLPRKITEEIQGIVVSKTYYIYIVDDVTQDRTEIVERAVNPSAGYGASGNERTVTVTYAYGENTAESGKTKSIIYPDGRMDSYTYEYGSYTPGSGSTPGTFTPGSGEYVRESVVHGTTGDPAGIANKTTKDIVINNPLGRQLLTETHVYTGSGYERISWSVQGYDDDGHVIEVNNSNGTRTESTWNCCGKDSDTDAQGIVRSYSYDDLNRVEFETRYADSGDITTGYTYDAAGRILTQSVSSSGLQLNTTNGYDTAGRIDYTIDQTGLLTDYAYSSGGLITTVARPGGASEITTNYTDGRVKSITGTGVVSRYYTYGVNADGTQWTKVNIGASDSVAWEKNTMDILGRIVSTEKPGPNGTETTQNIYNNLGQLERVVTPGQADMIYVYDSFGNQTLSGLDVDGNSMLELASTDRINGTQTSYAYVENNWWIETIQQVYAEESSANATTVSTQRERLTGLGVDNLFSEGVSIDIHGNQTVSKTYIDRANKTVTQAVDYPDSTIDATTVTINGLVESTQSKTGVAVTYGYDSLGRRTSVIDPKTGNSIIHYNTLVQVDYVEDAANNRTTITYDPATGQKLTETNPDNKVTRYEYNVHGQVIRTWGDAAEPVEYVYDDYDRMVEMHTYQGGTNWNAVQWPAGTTGPAEVTRWHYDEATGLLSAKEYDDGKSVSYTYDTGGQLETRTWARLDQGNPLVTTYGYDPATGELTYIDYSDSTPDVTFTYDRLGRQNTITDAVGTRTFGYNTQLQQETETITGLYNKVITRTYETSNVPGRSTGFNTGADYSVTYGYEPGTGRFQSVAWSVNAVNDAAIYSYLPNSDLLHQLSTDSGQLTTYSYEPNRNLKTQVKNEFNTQLISQYDYTYNNMGLRDNVNTSGDAFSGTNNVPKAKTIDYTTNTLNQYTQITTNNPQPAIDNLVYDDDGNLTSITSPEAGKTYAYNAENRLISVNPQSPVDGDTKVDFVYDYMGRRVQKKVYSYISDLWSLTSDTLFIYDGWNLIEEQETINQEQETKYYIYGLDLSQSLQGAGGVGGLLSHIKDQSSSSQLFCYDSNGNIGQLIDTNDGSIVAHYEYDPVGVLIKSSGTMADENQFRFSTKYNDTETDLYYYGYRYYSTNLGRWINRDPIEENDGLNIYIFVSNDPLDRIDYLGLWKRVSATGHIWIAESGDTLSSLAMKAEYGGKWQNWPCIWPEAGTKDHGYPNTIRVCDKYDASNLATPALGATSLDIRMESSFNNPSFIQFPYYSTSNAAYQAVRNASKEGRSPISLLRVDGHSCSTCNYTHGTGQGSFNRAGLVAYAAFAQNPTFLRAKQKKGPLRCWLARDVHVWSLGCSSGHTFASDFAGIVRPNGTVSGANATVYINATETWIGIGGTHHRTWTSYSNDPNWIHVKGTLN